MAGLPTGWASHVDEGSGATFYYNASTGETSWERPAAPAAAAGGLPAGWTEHTDPGSGAVFYYNAGTGETSWEKPKGAQADAPAAAGALPAGWTEHFDEANQCNFYHNSTTGETSWERPGGGANQGGAFGDVLRGFASYVAETKAAKAEAERLEEATINVLLAQYEPTVKQSAAEFAVTLEALRNDLLPRAQADAPFPLPSLDALNTGVQAAELRYSIKRSETITANLLTAQPGSKLYPNLKKKVEVLINRSLEDLEKRERDHLKTWLLAGGNHPELDAQRKQLEMNAKQSLQAIIVKHAQSLSPSDHSPVNKAVSVAGGAQVSVMCWNLMEFPAANRAEGQIAIVEGVVPLVDLVVKNLQSPKDERQIMLDAFFDDNVINQHTGYLLQQLRDAFDRGTEVIFLQEVGKDVQAHVDALCRERGWHSCFSAGNEDPYKCDGITAVLSCRPFEEQAQFPFLEGKKERYFAAVRQGTTWFVSCHVPLSNQSTEEAKQDVGVRLLQEMSQRFLHGCVLVAGGDWNTDVNGVRNRISMGMPYGCRDVHVYTDSKTCFGADFPPDGVICLQ